MKTECNGNCRSNAEHMERHAQGLGCIGNQFMKHDLGKTRYTLIPPECLQALAEHLTYGASKYNPENWKKVDSVDRYVDALMRHLNAWQNGEQFDEDGKLHMTAVFTNACFLLWFEFNEK